MSSIPLDSLLLDELLSLEKLLLEEFWLDELLLELSEGRSEPKLDSDDDMPIGIACSLL